MLPMLDGTRPFSPGRLPLSKPRSRRTRRRGGRSAAALPEVLEPRVLLASTLAVIDAAVNPANGHVYYVLGASNRTEAQVKAAELGGALVTVNDSAENAWIASRFGARPNLWLGLNDVASEGAYVHPDGTAATFFRWDATRGQPNDATNGAAEDFALMSTATGRWFDSADVTGHDGRPVFGLAEVNSVAALPKIEVSKDGRLLGPGSPPLEETGSSFGGVGAEFTVFNIGRGTFVLEQDVRISGGDPSTGSEYVLRGDSPFGRAGDTIAPLSGKNVTAFLNFPTSGGAGP